MGKLDDVLRHTDIENINVHAFEGLYLERSDYVRAAGVPGAATELARILDEHVGPAYRRFADARGIDDAEDLDAIGIISRGLTPRSHRLRLKLAVSENALSRDADRRCILLA